MSQSSGFQGVDVSGVEKVVREFTSALQKVERTISYVQALIVALRAAGFFTGGASVAYANYLQTTVLPWLRKVAMALQMAIQVLRTQLRDQEHASSLQTLGIEQLGYRTPELPASDTRAFPLLELPGSGSATSVPSGPGITGGAVAGASLGGGSHGGGSLGGALPPLGPGVGGGAGSGGAPATPVVTPSSPAPAYGLGVGSSVGGAAAGVAGGVVGGVAGGAPVPTAVAGAARPAVLAPTGGASSVGGGVGGGGAPTVGGAGAGAGGSGAASPAAGGGTAPFAAGEGGAVGGIDGDPAVRSRAAIADQPSGFAGRTSIGGSGGGEAAPSPLRDEVAAPRGGAGVVGAGLAAAGAVPLALRKGGQRLLGGDGQDLFSDDAGDGMDR